MATVAWTLDQPTWNEGDLLPRGVYVFKWANMASGDVGAPARVPQFTEKHVAVGGTFGSGGTVTMQVNDVPEGTARWSTAKDTHNDAMTFAASDGNPATKSMRPVMVDVRPNVTVGDVTTDLTVRMLVRP